MCDEKSLRTTVCLAPCSGRPQCPRECQWGLFFLKVADAGAEAEAAAIVPELPLSEIEQKIALDVSNALVGGYGELRAHIAGVVANLSVNSLRN